MKKNQWIALATVIGMTGASAFFYSKYQSEVASLSPDDPSWHFTRGSRQSVKARPVGAGAQYLNYNNGQPVSVGQFFRLVSSLENKLPRRISPKEPIPGVETIRIAVRGYLVSAKFQRRGDYDMHAHISEKPDSSSGVILLETPPGKEYQEARKNLWDMVREDSIRSGAPLIDVWKFRTPPLVNIEGFIFFDSHHGEGDVFVEADENEESEELEGEAEEEGKESEPPANIKLRYGWEIHPAFTIEKISDGTQPGRPIDAPNRNRKKKDQKPPPRKTKGAS